MTTVAASGPHRLRPWAVAIVVLLSTLFGGLPPASMVWPGSQTLCADVAVTVAVNPDHTPAADLLDYRITAGHSHGPPAIINGSASNGHTYYVIAGPTAVLVHNCDPSLEIRTDMANSGMRAANPKAEITKAGQEYQKHQLDALIGPTSKRFLPTVRGQANLETAGQKLLDDIVFHPRGVQESVTGGGFPGGTMIVRPDGVGAVFDADGLFQYFGKFQYRS